MKITMVSCFIAVVFSSLFILKIFCSVAVVSSTLMTIFHLVQYYATINYYHSSMLKVHLFRAHVTCNVYLLDTVYIYVQNNLSTEFRKRQFS